MKKVFLLLFSVLSLSVLGQTSFSAFNLANQKGVNAEQISVNNFWFGSKLSYNLTTDRPIDENFALTGRILYVPISNERYAIPIGISVSSNGQNALSAESGYNFGVYPYYKLVRSSQTTLLAHGGVGYKVLENVDPGESTQQIRAFAGLEAAFFSKEGGAPVTLSVTPVYTNTSGTLGNQTLLEVTGILPIAKNLGTLVEWRSGKGLQPNFSIGVILSSAVN